jgi:hypothetical protein
LITNSLWVNRNAFYNSFKAANRQNPLQHLH